MALFANNSVVPAAGRRSRKKTPVGRRKLAKKSPRVVSKGFKSTPRRFSCRRKALKNAKVAIHLKKKLCKRSHIHKTEKRSLGC